MPSSPAIDPSVRFVPLLRAPPFPGSEVAVTRAGASPRLTGAARDHVFAAIREERVGGSFWAPPAAERALVLMLDRTSAEAEGLAAQTLRPSLADAGQCDPWSLLEHAETLIAHGDDTWVGLAVIAGLEVHLLSRGRFGTPGDDAATLRATVADDLARWSYRDPFTGHDVPVEAVVALLGAWRRVLDANRGIVAACGFRRWKRPEIARFLWSPQHPLRFFRSERRALAHAARHGGTVAIWPSRVSPRMAAAAAAKSVPLVWVEDGFIRSAGLGSNLVPPSSVAVDRRGMHYDPGQPSDLEDLLAKARFSAPLLARAARLREEILAAGIGKYGSDASAASARHDGAGRRILVPAQVEDDMSVRLGGEGLSSNLELLRRVRALEPAADIWFRPHPDVDAGHRKGAVRDGDALHWADRIVRGGGMASLLDQVDAVHVLTSLTGFEALLRGREVICHGLPFYAGWGLTRDLLPAPDRRGRHLTLDELVAAVLILYPRYLDPVTALPCTPEVLIQRIRDGGSINRNGWLTRLRRIQGLLRRRRT